jgi:hypothetical protein
VETEETVERKQVREPRTGRKRRRYPFEGKLKAVPRQVAEDKRRRTQKQSTADRLQPHWRKQLSAEETKALATL